MRFAPWLVVLALAGCGVGERNGGGGNGAPGGSGGDDAGGSGPVGTIDPGAGDPCSASAKLVYVVDAGNTFSSFKPDTGTFVDIGTLSCPTTDPLDEPFSMAIDRVPSAWVLYSSGEVFHVDVNTLKCDKTPFQPGTAGFTQFGMGFVSNSAGSNDETLFIAGGTTAGAAGAHLGTLDTTTFAARAVGPIGGWPELTGTGGAELWGFFPDTRNPKVARISKTSGALSDTFALPTLQGDPAAWAFAFWGGDFWIFLQRANDTSTTVWHLVQSNGHLEAAVPNSGRHIVGAGVSTCAPVTIG
jgi:hypothetical protein